MTLKAHSFDNLCTANFSNSIGSIYDEFSLSIVRSPARVDQRYLRENGGENNAGGEQVQSSIQSTLPNHPFSLTGHTMKARAAQKIFL